jgi:hypothetical protein
MSTPEAVASYFKDLILDPRHRANTDASVCLELRSPLFESMTVAPPAPHAFTAIAQDLTPLATNQ